MLRRRKRPAISAQLTDRIDDAVASVVARRTELDRTPHDMKHLPDRRAAHADLERAFDLADALLREATAIAKQRSYREWSQWRSLLSRLDRERQIHLFAQQDESGILPLGSIRAIDIAMSAPDVGDLMHGQSKPPGSTATYGLDMSA
ncbi:MAG: hypothetical protein L0K86_24090 [Actinomycetia bacterium]|nr:hypothetical protein [Actinomycetes bacterium]